jgi:hypothetical protein
LYDVTRYATHMNDNQKKNGKSTKVSVRMVRTYFFYLKIVLYQKKYQVYESKKEGMSLLSGVGFLLCELSKSERVDEASKKMSGKKKGQV